MKNRTGRVLSALPLICAAMQSTAIAGDETEALARKERNSDRLLLTINNSPKKFIHMVKTRTKDNTTSRPADSAERRKRPAGGGKHDCHAVNFGSTNVTIVRRGDAMEPTQVITASPPLSVVFGHNHLAVLGQTRNRFRSGNNVKRCRRPVLKGDKSAAQIVTYDGGVLYPRRAGRWPRCPLHQRCCGLASPPLPSCCRRLRTTILRTG
jgi:hypothetical protein